LTVSTVDAKGDLLVGTGADAVGRLAVGTDGQLLSAASGETSGLKWANGGLTLIKTETFSAVSSVNVNNVFSATYDYYRILINFTTSTNGDAMSMRLRLSGTDNSGANTYKTQEVEAASTTIEGTRRSLDNFLLGAGSNVADSVSTSIIDLFNVSLASPTGFQTQNFSALSNGFIRDVKGFHTVSTAYDGFTFITSTGTMSGKLRVYGYNN
jgi:hypothetical protein